MPPKLIKHVDCDVLAELLLNFSTMPMESIQIKHLPNLRYTVAQLITYQVLVERPYQPYLNQLLIYAH